MKEIKCQDKSIFMGLGKISDGNTLLYPEALNIINSLFNTTFEHSSLGKALLDNEGNLLQINPRFCDIFAYPMHYLFDLYFFNKENERDDLEGCQLVNLLSLDPHKASNKEQVSFQKANGQMLHLLVSTSGVYDKNGEICFYVKAIEDLTELRNKEVQLSRIVKELDHLVYRAFHDLQGPLASIEGICNIINSDCYSEIYSYTNMIRCTTNKMKRALLGMLETSKVNGLEFNLVRIDFEEIVANLLADIIKLPDIWSTNFDKKIQKNINFCSEPTYLSMIIRHLVENAVVFRDTSKDQTLVKLDIFQLDDLSLVIVVEDNGVGIRNSDQQEIFDMFCRKSSLSQGAGIGLYLVKQMVSRLGGNIQLESELGQGTKVTVLLN